MIKSIVLQNVGPSDSLSLDPLGERLNLITGDNGLGKSFLLDSIWWALTRKWPAEINPQLLTGRKAKPNKGTDASISFHYSAKSRPEAYTSNFDRKAQAWTGRPGRPANPGLILYAMSDGGFALWDPARNYWLKKGGVDVQDRPSAYVFNPSQVWNGLPGDEGRMLCNGLIQDWAGWQKEDRDVYRLLRAVLEALSPSISELLVPGDLTRVELDDVRDMPTLRMSYGREIPVIHASAGMRRIIALAYFLVWAWEEHKKAADLLGEPRTTQLIFLIDEIESHLHPSWQKRIVPSLLDVVKRLSSEMQSQLVVVTHSPLILASAEPHFSPETDAWFDLDLVDQKVILSRREFRPHGDILNWLTSHAFDQKSGRAWEYEQLLDEASNLLAPGTIPDHEAVTAMHARLSNALNPQDGFLLRWRVLAEKRGVGVL